jgi:hypothetical protein
MSGLDEEAKKQAAEVTARAPEAADAQPEAERLEKRKQAFLDVFVKGNDIAAMAGFGRASDLYKTEKDAAELRYQIGRMFSARVLPRLIKAIETILNQGKGIDLLEPKSEAKWMLVREFQRLVPHQGLYSIVRSDYPYNDAYKELADFINEIRERAIRGDGQEEDTYHDFEALLSRLRGIQASKGPDDEEQKLWDMLGFTAEDREKIAGARREKEERYGKS